MSDKAKPIIFSTDMVRAILAGKKTITRQVVKPCFDRERDRFARIAMFNNIVFRCGAWRGISLDGITFINDDIKQPPNVGDILYVRETWCYVSSLNDGAGNSLAAGIDLHKVYMTDGVDLPEGCRWCSPASMPKAAARIFLRVQNVRVEKLQDISERDCVREGIGKHCTREYKRPAFIRLWDSLNSKREDGKYAWDKNPWVWVIEFERVKVNVD